MKLEKVVIDAGDSYDTAGNKILNMLCFADMPKDLTYKEFRDNYVVFPSEEYKQAFLLYWKDIKYCLDPRIAQPTDKENQNGK